MFDRRRTRSRLAVAALIIAGHVGVIAVAMLARGPMPASAEPEPIIASILLPDETETPAPALTVPEPVMALPEVVVPVVLIDIRPEEPPPVQVAVMSSPPVLPAPPQQPAVSMPAAGEVDNGEPVIATAVEYLRPPVVAYPPAARQARAEGTVHVRALVEQDGRVREVRVDRSSGFPLLDKAAIEAVSGALFRPYLHNGRARAAVVIIPVDFALKARKVARSRDTPGQRCAPQRDAQGGPLCQPDTGRRSAEMITQALTD